MRSPLRPFAFGPCLAAMALVTPIAAMALAGCTHEEKPAAQPTAQPAGGGAPAPAATGGESTGGGATLASQIAAHKRSILDGVSDGATRKAIMKDISRQLGATCDDCHDVSDFAAPSVNKTIANYMFTHFGVALAEKGGTPLTCERCHGGATKFLDRSDKEKLGRFMYTEYVQKLQQQGGGEVRCETCHVNGKDQPFLPRK